jgi:hypothetical protein
MVCSFAFAADAASTATQNITITVPTWDLITATTNTGSSLAVVAPVDAGAAPTLTGTCVANLQYSSCVIDGDTRNITAYISSGLPAGLHLQVVAADNGANGIGTAGTVPTAAKTARSLPILGTSALTLVGGIGSCYTTTTGTAGPSVTYNLAWLNDTKGAGNDPSTSIASLLGLIGTTYTTTVTYTISAEGTGL